MKNFKLNRDMSKNLNIFSRLNAQIIIVEDDAGSSKSR